MYDMHYDLLTILYFNLIGCNKFSNREKLFSDLKKIYRSDNIIGGIINLYFMTADEMLNELDISLDEMKNIKKMFSESIECFNLLKKVGIIPYNLNVLYGIEGCDYINDENELEELYGMGLRSIILVWNHKNQYGSGIRTIDGLTAKGRGLIKKAINLGIIIDVSHANEKTFDDILNLFESYKTNDSIIMASHSNVRSLYNRSRNLTDEQLIKLKEAGGYIGIFTNGNFVSQDNPYISYDKRENNFLKHLDYLINNIGFDINKIILSTDDMNYYPDNSYHNLEVIPIENVACRLFDIISSRYGEDVARKIIRENASAIINKVSKL